MSSQLEEKMYRLIIEHGFPAPEREYMFHASRKWRFDFAWPEQQIALEVEGGIWVRGRHNRGKGFTEDCKKYGEALRLGWTVYRVVGDMIESGEAVKTLRAVFDMREQLDELLNREVANYE